MFRMMIRNDIIFRIIAIFIILIMLSFNIKADESINNKRMEDIINRQLEIQNFLVDIVFKVSFKSGKRSDFDFTYYYQEPDRVYLETEDFVLLPKDALQTLQPGFFYLDRYTYRYLNAEKELQRFEFLPVDDRQKYRLILWIDLDNSSIKFAEVFFRIEEYEKEFYVQIDYEQFRGYSLPVYVEGKLAIPSKFGMGGEIKQFQEGSFSLELSNYQINTQFSDKIKRKLSE